MTYQQTYEVLEKFYEDCVKFWERENHEYPKVQALVEVSNLKYNPFSPLGREINGFAKVDFIRKTIID